MHPLAEKYDHLFEKRRGFVFLVSHMRSYSSLLGHLLAETHAVDGYSELHQTYESDLDLLRMAIDVQATHSEEIQGSYLFDKLLHRAYTVATQLAMRDDVRVVFSIRTPLPTLASLVALGERDPTVRWAADPERALLHYARRVNDICTLAEQVPSAAFLFADNIVSMPRPTLDALGEFLGLDEQIPERYGLRPRTGHKKSGDSSPAILSGTISPDQPPILDLPSHVCDAGIAAFAEAPNSESIRRLHAISEHGRYV